MPFANPALLAGLGLVSLPIIIHLLNRRRFKIVRWAAMEYLLAANKRNRRRVRFEHLIVLLLRCLAVALIVLAVARPWTSSDALAFLPGASERVERVLVIDDSASMGYKAGRSTAFERARRLTDELVTDLRAERPSDLVTAFRTSRLEPELFRSPLNDQVDAFLRRLEEAAPSHRTFDVPGTLERVLERLTDAEEEGAPLQRVVYLVTDLKRRDWIGPEGALPQAIGRALRQAPEGTRFLVVDVSGQERANLSVTELRPLEKLAMTQVPIELEVEVANRGEADVYDVPLVLETGESRVPLPPIARIAAGEAARVRHRYTYTAPGPRALTVRLPEDALAADDERHLALDVHDGLKVLLVDGEEGTGPLADETDLLRLALAPPGDVLTGVDPVVVAPRTLGEEELGGYQAVVLCNVERLPPERVRALERYVERGGGLAVFLGDQVDAEAWEEELYRDGEGLLPCRLGRRYEVERVEDAPSLAPPDEEHPLVEVFAGERNPFLRRIRGRTRYGCPIDEERDPTTKVLLRFADPERTPLIVERSYGRGRVVLLNTTADLAWTTWPRDPSYPVVAQELVRLLAPAATTGRNLPVGEPLERGVHPAAFEPLALLRPPGEAPPRELHAEPREGSDALWLTFADTERAGVYRLELAPRQATARQLEPYAANLDASEGETAPADPARLLPSLEGVAIRFEGASEGADLLALSDGDRAELWRTCLLALVLCMALEQVLAWRAAHHTPAPRGEALA